jgi:hypothetical protein
MPPIIRNSARFRSPFPHLSKLKIQRRVRKEGSKGSACQARLENGRHTGIVVAVDIYSHDIPAMHGDAVAAMGAVLTV